MSSDHANGEAEAQDSLRPTLSFESITFSDGQTLTFDDDEIIVLVGPNNAGKSAALKELNNWVHRSTPQTVIKNAVIKRLGTASDLRGYLESHALITGDPGQLYYRGMGFQIHHAHVNFFDNPSDRHPIAPFFTLVLPTETRLNGSDPAGAIALYNDPPSHPIHLLMMDDELAARISGLFRRAFGEDLIVFRAGGSTFPLYVGQKPAEEYKDELSRSFVEKLQQSAIQLQRQGDGMRSFATAMLYVLAPTHHSIQFLDEPEAFLHPPQARLLGEYIARERQAKSQLFIATHSTDVLEGLMTARSEKVRVIRIQRNGDVNRIKELGRERTAAIAHDPLTRYSGVFEGIFYTRVIIAESDADCLFYSSLLNTGAVSGERRPDALFIHASGKHRMARLADLLRALDVPVSVIADFDILNEENNFRTLVESLGGDWQDILANWRAIKASVEALNPPLNSEQVKGLIEHELAEVSGVSTFPDQVERNIKRIFRRLSPWDIVKQVGRSGLRGGQSVNHFDMLAAKCAALGLWIVPVGELEGFCRSIEAAHGPAFVEKVLETKDLNTDPELEDARQFVAQVWSGEG